MSSPAAAHRPGSTGQRPPPQQSSDAIVPASSGRGQILSSVDAPLANYLTAAYAGNGSGNDGEHGSRSSRSKSSMTPQQAAQQQQRQEPLHVPHILPGKPVSPSSPLPPSDGRSDRLSSSGLRTTQPLAFPHSSFATVPSSNLPVPQDRPPLRGSSSDGMSGATTSPSIFIPQFNGHSNAAGPPPNPSATSQRSPLISQSSDPAPIISPNPVASSTYGLLIPPGSTPGDPRTSLMVSNLPYKVRWQDLKDLFRRSAGTVLRADVSLTPDGRSRLFGSVLMRDPEDASRAKETFDGFEWMGNRLTVTYEIQSQPTPWTTVPQQQYPSQASTRPQLPSFSAPLPPPPSMAKSPALLPFLSSTGRADSANSNTSSRSLPSSSRVNLYPRSPGMLPSPAVHHNDTCQQQPTSLPHPSHLGRTSASFSGASQGADTRRSSIQESQRPTSVRSPQPLPPLALASQPNSIPTQHQIAVLSAQAAQAAVAAQQARVVAEYGGTPEASYYGRTLFVGNLAYATQWQDLKDLFRAAGNILRADIALGPEGRSRGFGTALFSTTEEAARAVKIFHGYDYNGRTLKVHFDRFARMEAPPLGVLVPARSEDYTSAFSAAQPPSNVAGQTGGGPKSMSSGPSAGLFTNGMLLSATPSLPTQQAYPQVAQIQQHPYALPPPYQQQAGFQYSQHQHQQQYPLYHQQQPQQHQHQQQLVYQHQQSHAQNQRSTLPASVPYFDGRHTPQSREPRPAAVSSSHLFASQLAEPFLDSKDKFEETSTRHRPHQEQQTKSQSTAEADPLPSSRNDPLPSSSKHPGRISLPSPPSISRQFNPYASNASTSPAHYRAPMPMTPGVPLTPGVPMTPGMPGFSFAGMIPPPTPPTFVPPFLNGGSGPAGAAMQGMMAMTPGAAPPTPWQISGMSAAPGAPLRLMSGGPTTPRGVAGGSFNPFFAGVVGYNANLPPTPGWHRGPTGRIEQQTSQRQNSSNGSMSVERGSDESQSQEHSKAFDKTTQSLASNSSNSSSISGLSSIDEKSARSPVEEHPGTHPSAIARVSEEDIPGDLTTKSTPSALGLPPFQIARRASTNSSAMISPGLVGISTAMSGSSFGYFGSVVGGEGITGDEKGRRPSLDASALRTPMNQSAPTTTVTATDDYFGAAEITPVVAGGSTSVSAPSIALGNDDADLPAGVAGGGDARPTVRPVLTSDGRQASTEEMARTIAKMSIQGKALLKRGSSNSSAKMGDGT